MTANPHPTPRLPPGEPRLQLLDFARHCVAVLEANHSRGARLIVHLCEGLHLALLDLGGAEMRARKAEAALAEAEKVIARLEARVQAELDVPARSEIDIPTASRRAQPLVLCR